MLLLASALLVTTSIYFAVTTTCDLHPFNNARALSPNERRVELGANLPVMLLPLLLVHVADHWQAPVAAYVAGGLMLLAASAGLCLWWLPYLLGISVPWATATKETWSSLHQRIYEETIIVVPAWRNRPRPNLEHMLLHGLMVASGVSALWLGRSL